MGCTLVGTHTTRDFSHVDLAPHLVTRKVPVMQIRSRGFRHENTSTVKFLTPPPNSQLVGGGLLAVTPPRSHTPLRRERGLDL